MKLSPVGTSTAPNTKCYTFAINTSSDWLRYVRLGYNATGVYGLEFQTQSNRTARFGISLEDPSITRTGVGLQVDENGRPDSKIMGFKGTFTDQI